MRSHVGLFGDVRGRVAVMAVAAVIASLLSATPVGAQSGCSTPQVQTHRGIQGTFDQCVDVTFSEGGSDYVVHVYYTETATASDAAVCSSASPPLPAAECEHALADDDDADGDNVDAVLVGDETADAWRFFIQQGIPIVSGDEMTVYIGEDGRGGGIPTCSSLWWDDEWIDGGDVLTARVLAYHEAFHLAQFCQYDSAAGSHGEGVARAIEDRVDAALDANLGNLFIPEVDQHLRCEGPNVPNSDGDLPTPRCRADDLNDQWYWSAVWWTYLFDQTASPGDAEPQIGWDAIVDLYESFGSHATDVGAADALLASQGSSFAEAFRRYGQAMFAYPWAPSDPALRFRDAEITTNAGPLAGHTIRTGAPAAQTDTFTMNPRSNVHVEYRPDASCTAVTFEFDGGGTSYGWSVLGVEEPVLDTVSESVGDSWAATVMVGDLTRIGGVITSTASAGDVDVRSGCTTPTLEIEDPTTATPATVGEATDPDRLLVRVDVDGPSGEPVQGLSADDFTASLAEGATVLPAAVESAAYVQSDYWLLLALPDQAAGAVTGTTYDLTAQLGTATATQPDAVTYAERPDVDVVVVTDQSGSMADSDKIEAARNAGELLVEELRDDDHAGYVAFDDAAVLRQPLAPLGVADHRDDVQDDIRAEVPDGGTSIGAGMRTAAEEEAVRGVAEHECAFVLLSDGAENRDPRWADVAGGVADNGCPIHTVGLGPGANEVLLQEIAAAVPGGSYDYAGTGPGGGAFAAEFADLPGGATTWQNGLAAIYDLFSTRVAGRERVLSSGFSEPPTAMSCTKDVLAADFADARPTEVGAGEQMTSGGIAFDGVAHSGARTPETAGARVTRDDRVEFDFLSLVADVPACRVDLVVETFNAVNELRVNGEVRTFRTLSEIDGATIGGASVRVIPAGDFSGTIVLEGALTSYGFGGTRTDDAEFPARVFLDRVGVVRGTPGGIPFHVDDTTAELVVATTAQTPVPGQLTQLYDPTGAPVPTATSRREPHGSSEVWEVVAPAPGTWRLVVNDQFTVPGVVGVSAVTDLSLELLLSPTEDLVDAATTGVEVPIVAAFTGQGGPVTGASVTATVTDPSGFARDLVLHDDGQHGDGAADDGFYGGSYTATSFGDVTAPDPTEGEEPQTGGSYRVSAVGTIGPDRREDSGAFALARAADRDGDGLPDSWEIEHGLDPSDRSDATGDDDRDDLDARCEFQAGTDPRVRDTDGGGEADGTEVRRGSPCRPGPTDPTDPADDRVSPLDSLVAVPELDDRGRPVVDLTWGDPLDDGDRLVEVDVWRRPLDRETLRPAGPWVLVLPGRSGDTATDGDVEDGEVWQYEVVPTIEGDGGPLPADGSPSGPVVVSDDPYAPEGTVLIEGGVERTDDPTVRLDLTVDDLSDPGHAGPDGPPSAPEQVPGSTRDGIEMRIANGTSVPEDTPWVPFEPVVKGWELDPDIRGLAVVSVQYRDEAGNVGAGGLFMKDSILVGSSDRVGGPTRIETAVIGSQEAFPRGASSVVLARADTFPDAQAGSPLAVSRRGPILLTPTDSLHPATRTEIQRLLPPNAAVYLLGSFAAISQAVEDEIRAMGYRVIRYGGSNRFETATIIAEQGLGSPDTVLVADGGRFQDSILAASAAALEGAAVLLTSGGDVPPETTAYLSGHSPDLITIGESAGAAFPAAEGVSGADPAATSVAVAERFADGPRLVGIATDAAFADALTGSSIVANPAVGAGPMLFSSPDVLPQVVDAYLRANRGSISQAVLLGGTAALTNEVDSAVRAALAGP